MRINAHLCLQRTLEGDQQRSDFCPNYEDTCAASHVHKDRKGNAPRKLGIQEAFLTQVLFLSLRLGLGCTVSQSPKGLLNAKLVCLSTSVPAAKSRNQTW